MEEVFFFFFSLSQGMNERKKVDLTKWIQLKHWDSSHRPRDLFSLLSRQREKILLSFPNECGERERENSSLPASWEAEERRDHKSMSTVIWSGDLWLEITHLSLGWGCVLWRGDIFLGRTREVALIVHWLMCGGRQRRGWMAREGESDGTRGERERSEREEMKKSKMKGKARLVHGTSHCWSIQFNSILSLSLSLLALWRSVRLMSNNRCHRCLKGVSRRIPCFVAWSLLLVLSCLYFFFVCPSIMAEFSFYVPLGQAILLLMVISNLLFATLTDPGRYSRAPADENDDSETTFHKTGLNLIFTGMKRREERMNLFSSGNPWQSMSNEMVSNVWILSSSSLFTLFCLWFLHRRNFFSSPRLFIVDLRLSLSLSLDVRSSLSLAEQLCWYEERERKRFVAWWFVRLF